MNEYVLLGDIASITNGKRNAQDAVENGQYPLYDRSSTVKRSDKYLYDKEAVLVAGEGKSFYPKYYNGKFDLHQRCYAIFDFSEQFLGRYIYYFIYWNQSYFQSVYTGSTVPSLRLGNFEKMPIKNLTLNQQRQIVSELDSINKALSYANKRLLALDEIIKSRFIEMFGNITNKKPLGDLTTKITDGSHNPPKGIDKSEYKMLSSQNVYDELILDDVRYLTKEDFENENKRTDIQNDDVLLTIVGTVGRTYVVKNDEKYVFQRSVGVIKPIKNVLNGTFLSIYLQTQEAINQIESGAHGSSQKGIYLNDLKKLMIPVADYELQNKFAEYVKLIDKSKFVCRFIQDTFCEIF